MHQPNLVKTLHFRITVAFVLLLAVSGGAYYLWMDSSLYSAYDDSTEEHWYEDLAADEMDSLAARLAPLTADSTAVAGLLREYGRTIADFDAEVIVFDAAGRSAWSTDPDSLNGAVAAVDTALLRDMSDGEWDFGSYPVADDINAYENRIFEVRRIVPPGGSAEHPAGFLAASFMPPTVAVGEMENADRRMGLNALLLLLVYAAASSMIIMLWTTRRIRRLSTGVAAFTAGDLAARVPGTSADEIGALGRHINAMAERIEGMVTELTQKERFQRQLVANVSHDLRTPLASLRGYVETLTMGGREVGEDERHHYLDVITGKLDHLDRLIDHVLMLSRMDSGQTAFHCEEFSLGELAGMVVDRCAAAARGRDLDLSLELEPELPEAYGDPLQIGLVLQNLVENGIKFTPGGGRVAVRARRRDRALEVEVADTGIGIDPEDLPHIFERFYTGDKSRTALRGKGSDDHLSRSSGLGLAIAARIVEGHGSRLEVRSSPGTGSLFRFRLAAGPDTRRSSAAASA